MPEQICLSEKKRVNWGPVGGAQVNSLGTSYNHSTWRELSLIKSATLSPYRSNRNQWFGSPRRQSGFPLWWRVIVVNHYVVLILRLRLSFVCVPLPSWVVRVVIVHWGSNSLRLIIQILGACPRSMMASIIGILIWHAARLRWLTQNYDVVEELCAAVLLMGGNKGTKL